MTERRFQVSLQRMLVAVALFAIALGIGLVGLRSLHDPDAILIVVFCIQVIVGAPVGYLVRGWQGAVTGVLIASLALLFIVGALAGYQDNGWQDAVIGVLIASLMALFLAVFIWSASK